MSGKGKKERDDININISISISDKVICFEDGCEERKTLTGHSSLGRVHQQHSVSILRLQDFRSMTRGSVSFLGGGLPAR
jgi:hypothetical protein